MEIVWEGRPCGPKGYKRRKGLLLSSKHKINDKVGNMCSLHHTQISKENPSKPNFQSWQHFTSPKPTFPSWKYVSPPNPNIKVEKHFTQDHDWKLEGFVFSTSPNFEVGSIRLSIRTRLLGLVVLQKTRFHGVVFDSPNFNDGNMSCLFNTHFSKFTLFAAGARPKFQH